MTEIIVVTSGKGGVGKTTTSASLAVGLAKRGKKVAVIDFDVGLRNLDLIMGCERRVVYDFVNVIHEECTLKQALIKDKRFETLYVLAASQTRDKDALSKEGVERVLKELTEDGFDYIVCDSPAGIEKGASLAMYFADRAVVVVNPEVSSVRDSDRILGLLSSKTRRAELGNGPVEQHLLLTRYNPERVAGGDMMGVDDVKEILGIEVLGVIPGIARRAGRIECRRAGDPRRRLARGPGLRGRRRAPRRRDAADAFHRSAKEGLPRPHVRGLIDGHSGFLPFAPEEHGVRRQGAPAHHRRAGTRGSRAGRDYLPLLRREILEVIRKYVNVDPDAIDIHVERDGDSEVLELSVALPERNGNGAPTRTRTPLRPPAKPDRACGPHADGVQGSSTTHSDGYRPPTCSVSHRSTSTAFARLLARHGLALECVADGAPIPGSYWGESEAGVIGTPVHARADTPVHSLLHEACHLIVAPRRKSARRSTPTRPIRRPRKTRPAICRSCSPMRCPASARAHLHRHGSLGLHVPARFRARLVRARRRRRARVARRARPARRTQICRSPLAGKSRVTASRHSPSAQRSAVIKTRERGSCRLPSPMQSVRGPPGRRRRRSATTTSR